jgi:hypothetical protein
MSAMSPNPSNELHELRRKVDGGQYAVDAQQVADSMVQKIIQIGRIRRSLGRSPDGQSRPPGASHQ